MTIQNGELYWKGKKIKVANRLDLTLGEKVGAILVVIGTCLSPCATYFTGLEGLCNFTDNKAPFCGIRAATSKPGALTSLAVAASASAPGSASPVASDHIGVPGPAAQVAPAAIGASSSVVAHHVTKKHSRHRSSHHHHKLHPLPQ